MRIHTDVNICTNMLLSVFFVTLCAWITNGSIVQSDGAEGSLPTGLQGEPADKSTFRLDYKFYPQADGWLKLHRIPVPWDQAKLTCIYEDAHLASPLTEGLAMVMTNLAQEAQLWAVHTGFHSSATPEDYYSSEGVHLSRIPMTWADGEPNNLDDKERCLTMTSQGGLADTNCKTGPNHPFFCYKKKKGYSTMNECGYSDKLYQVDPKTGHCYKFHTERLVWHDAQRVCTAEGGTLAVINSEAEAKFIENLTIQNNNKDNWILLGFRNWYHPKYIWLTMEGTHLKNSGFTRWFKGEPNNLGGAEFCGSFIVGRNNGPLELNDYSCTIERPFVCEISPPGELSSY